MKICVTQKEGVRYFSRFANIAERDKLEIEIKFEDKNGKTVLVDLTSALLDEYAKCPDIGRIDPAAAALRTAISHKPVKIKKSVTMSPAYLSDSKKEKDEIVAKVREAQKKAVAERNKKQAEMNAARTERLVYARKVKAENESAKLTQTQADAIKKINDALKKAEAKAKPAAKNAKTARPTPKATAKPPQIAPAKTTLAKKTAAPKAKAAMPKKKMAKS